jgi:hypothetical protein
LRIADNDRLDIHEVDRVGRALEQVRTAKQLPDRMHKWPFCYAGLLTLHCVNYRKMNPTTLAGLPDALLAAFELNDISGPLFLGQERWPEVRSHYRQKFAQSALIPAAVPQARQSAAGVCDTPIMTLSTLAKLRANAGSAVQAIEVLLRDALAPARSAWAQLTKMWSRQLEPDPSNLFLPARSSPSHPPCHYARHRVPAGASIPVAIIPDAAPDPTEVCAERVPTHDAPDDCTTYAYERRRAPRIGRQFPRDSKSQDN